MLDIKKNFTIAIIVILFMSLMLAPTSENIITKAACAPVCGSCDTGFEFKNTPVGVRCFKGGTNTMVDQGCCGGGGGGGTPPTPICTPSNPTAPKLLNPSNGSIVSNNDVTLSWNENGSWGTSCATDNNQYKVYISLNCKPTNYYPVGGPYAQGTTSTIANNLEWGQRYCWFVQKTNGVTNANSEVWDFTVNKPPKDISGGFKADICGNGITGRANSLSPSKSNPMEYLSSFTDEEGDTFSDIQIAFIPVSTYNAELGTSDQILQYSFQNQSIAVKVDLVSAYIWAGSTLKWVTNGGGDLTNSASTATVLAQGTTSKMEIIDKSAKSNMLIRFENTFASGTYNIYIMGVTRNSDGTLVSSNATSSQNLVFKKMGTWKFDMVNPTASIVNIAYVGNSFTMQWLASDSSGLKNGYSYIWADANGSSLVDSSVNQTISPLGVTELNYPATANGNISASDLLNGSVNRNYGYSGLTVEYSFKMVVEDNACNIADATTKAIVPEPWITVRDGIISANKGVSDITLPTTIVTMNITDFAFPETLVNVGGINLTTGSAISGNTELPIPSKTISSRDIYTFNYTNQATKPDTRSGQTNWYNYVLDRVTRNGDTEIINDNTAGSFIRSGKVSEYIDALKGSASNANDVYLIKISTGNITFTNLECDRNVIVLSSKLMTLVPDIRKTLNTGCIFLSEAQITVTGGDQRTINIPLSQGGDSKYDIVEAYLVTDGIFVTPEDINNASNQWDGLLIKGGVLANSTNMDRTLNGSGNGDQPAMVFRYDPFYSIIFKDVLATRYFSIREVNPSN